MEAVDTAVRPATVVEEKRRAKKSFDGSALTEQQKEKLGVSAYYRPYIVDRKAALADRKVYWAGKRAFDILGSLLALVVLSPLLLITALAIVLEDPKGGPIFKQKRSGKDGKIFEFYKFRSMCVDAEVLRQKLIEFNEFQGQAFKIKDDPRITKVGKLIRNCSIDELPQLVNILKGDMSIVGPRPLPVYEENYDDAYEMQRLTVTPGLTCFWQVYPHRHEITFDDWLALDIKYVAERSWWVDLKMIFKTVLVVFAGNAD